MAPSELILSGMGEEMRQQAVEEAFQALRPGQGVVLVTSGLPRALLRYLIQAHWREFDWAPLVVGEPDWRVGLTKRDSLLEETLVAFLGGDHARCDSLLAEAEAAANNGNLERTREMAGAYLVGMRRHFEMEEEGFFREFEARMGIEGSGPIGVMREEHMQMRGLLTQMEMAVAASELETFLSVSDTMVILMEQHNVKEEEMLYPMADEAFAGGVEALLKNLMLF